MTLIKDETVDEMNGDGMRSPIKLPPLQSLMEYRNSSYWNQIATMIDFPEITVLMPVKNSIVTKIGEAQEALNCLGINQRIDIISFDLGAQFNISEMFGAKLEAVDPDIHTGRIPSMPYPISEMPENECVDGHSFIAFRSRDLANTFFSAVDSQGDSVVRLCYSGRSNIHAHGALFELKGKNGAHVETARVWPTILLVSGL